MEDKHQKSHKRRRNKQLIIRLTDSEMSEFTKKMKRSKLKSRADFIMALVRDKPIIVPDGFREIAVELKREGNNFKQCLRFMNSTQQKIPSFKMMESFNSLNRLYSRLGEMLDGLNMVAENADI